MNTRLDTQAKLREAKRHERLFRYEEIGMQGAEAHASALLDEALEMTFPASDPIAVYAAEQLSMSKG